MPHFLFFVPGDLDLLTFDLKFELRRDFCTVHLITKFHHPTFDPGSYRELTNNKLTNKLECGLSLL